MFASQKKVSMSESLFLSNLALYHELLVQFKLTLLYILKCFLFPSLGSTW